MKSLTFLLSFLFLFSGFVSAQVYEVSTCEDLGLNPVQLVQDNEGGVAGGESIISIYLEGDPSTGIGGLGCWAHHHPNGKDFVITPFSWGETPGGGRMAIIREVMQAITDSRTKYAALGTMDMDLHYLLDDVYYSRHRADGSVEGMILGLKFWLYNTNQCWMRSGVPTLRGLSPEKRKQVFAHEVGHCFNEENAPAFAWRWDTLNKWVQESVAEYLSSEVYKRVDYEHRVATRYNFDKPFYEQPYSSYVLFRYYAMHQGEESIVPLMKEIINKDNQRARIEYLQRTGFDRIFHEFLFDWTYNKIEDSGGHIKIPKTDVGSDALINLRDDMVKVKVDKDIKNGQRELYLLNVPEGYDILLKPMSGTDLPFFQSLFVEGKEKIDFWDAEIEIEGHCSRPMTIQWMVSHLNVEDLSDLEVEFDLIPKDGCCESGLVVEANPDENNINGWFYFDYYIESTVNSLVDGESQSFPMNYYVNSKDGSMLLTQSWFTEAFGSDTFGRKQVEAVIWLPNGQLVAYIFDETFGPRAITIALNQTRSEIMGIQAMKAAELVRLGPSSGLRPAPLPHGSSWEGYASGMAIRQPERSDPSQINKISAYLSNDSYPISSPLASFGFLTGYIRDAANQSKKLVYSKVELPGGNFYEGHLQSMDRMCFQFDAVTYKKMTIGASRGAIAAMSYGEQQEFANDQNALQEEMMRLLSEMSRCGDDKACEAEYTRRMMEIQKRQQDAYFDLQRDDSYSGTAADDLLAQQRALRDEMYPLQQMMVDKELQCHRLREQSAACGGCRDDTLKRCKVQYQELKDQMYVLECRMAKLMGAGDMMQDCPR